MRLLLLFALLSLSPGCATVEGWIFGVDDDESTEPAATGDTVTSDNDVALDVAADITTTPPDPVNDDCELIPTFSSIEEKYLGPSCTFASCHDSDSPAGSLDLTPGNAWDALVDVAAVADSTQTLVIPTDPDNSYLVQRVEGTAGTFMPQGITEPMDPECRIATLRAWIMAGALPD